MRRGTGARSGKEMHMGRTLCVFVGFLALLGSTPPMIHAEEPDPCVVGFLPEGAPCDDGNFCNGTDQCATKVVSGKETFGCLSHTGDPCEGGLPCANAACNETEKNCFNPAGTACPDDGNECSADVCDGVGECTHPPTQAGTECEDDGNVCTDDACDGAGECVHTNNSRPCADGLYCNGPDVCSEGTCSLHLGNPCADGPECAETCNEEEDNCFTSQGVPCSDDGNICTADVCDGFGVCAHPPNDLQPCDDGRFCNGEDMCGNGTCSFHTGDPCAGGCVEICDESSRTCVEPQGTPCDDDRNACTEDLCMKGACTHLAIAGCEVCTGDGDCDDANPCTVDTCGVAGCENTLIPDCRTCTAATDCDDGDACTAEECSPAGQCLYTDAHCFAALSCRFVERLGADDCAGEALPRTITRLVKRAGCRIEQAERRARSGRNRIARRLKSGQRRIARAVKLVGKARDRSLSAACSDALAADLADRLGRIRELTGESANGDGRLASCTAALAAPDATPQQPGPLLCRTR